MYAVTSVFLSTPEKKKLPLEKKKNTTDLIVKERKVHLTRL